ncbi:hypothetical protein BMS3Abin08_00317 [bacterium BMS3Abin08]|nr:hypothetical protein BMS3Abin08_00317 [bacterium BMS3Abin08]
MGNKSAVNSGVTIRDKGITIELFVKIIANAIEYINPATIQRDIFVKINHLRACYATPCFVTPELNSGQALNHVSRKISGYCFRLGKANRLRLITY